MKLFLVHESVYRSLHVIILGFLETNALSGLSPLRCRLRYPPWSPGLELHVLDSVMVSPASDRPNIPSRT